jgi:hypothetical protein
MDYETRGKVPRRAEPAGSAAGNEFTSREETMPRLRLLERHEVDREVGAICDASERETGSSASTRTLAHHPPVVRALNTFRQALAKESVLEPTLKELVRLKIANRNACRY